MDQKEQLVLMAEDELTQYSTQARKIERLRRKVGLAVPYPQQKAIYESLLAEMPDNPFLKLIETQRQAIALPFWGIGGLGLLFGISFTQPLDFIATFFGFWTAFSIQKWGWKLAAKRLAIATLAEIEAQLQASRAAAAESSVARQGS